MHLILVRHAESVDNVAGLLYASSTPMPDILPSSSDKYGTSAGSRDAALSSHGALQAQRLAAHLRARVREIGPVKHLFSSGLQRARKTAEAIAQAQAPVSPAVTVVHDLRERDFGSREGDSFWSKARNRESHTSTGASSWVPPESLEDVLVRARRFVTSHLMPISELVAAVDDAGSGAVVVVSHGIFISALLTTLQRTFRAPVQDYMRYPLLLSNTGYVELVISAKDYSNVSWAGSSFSPVIHSPGDILPSAGQTDSTLHKFMLEVKSVNKTVHLDGLMRTKGGIGNGKYDPKQRKMDIFFHKEG